ncbi:MAG: enhanced intracellular survival protein Eis [Dehalococcoidia bacterium]
MDLEIRHLTAGELPAFNDHISYVFASDRQHHEDAAASLAGAAPWMRPEWALAAFDAAQPVSTLGAYPVDVRVNGRPVPTAAVTTVGTNPGYRRRGLQRRVMTRALEWHRESGQAIAMLWASFGAIYQRYGYGLASAHASYTFEPMWAALRDPFASDLRVRLVDWTRPEVRAQVERTYAAFAAPRNLLIERSDWWWSDHRWYWEFEQEKERRAFLAFALDSNDRVRGYVNYRLKEHEVPFEPGPNQELETGDFVALDLEAWKTLWEFIRGHDLVKTVKFRWAPEDDLATDLLLEPRALRRQTGDAMWLRVVDVAQALEARGYEPDAEGAVVLGVRDELCQWNDGGYRVSIEGGQARVKRVRTRPQITLPVAALGSLYSGFRSATQLARAGRVEGSAEALRTADRLFATAYRPHVMDGF